MQWKAHVTVRVPLKCILTYNNSNNNNNNNNNNNKKKKKKIIIIDLVPSCRNFRGTYEIVPPAMLHFPITAFQVNYHTSDTAAIYLWI